MAENTDYIRTMFIRQRRNLMGISIVLLFVTYSGLKITTLNILGNSMTITQPHIVNVALWVAFTYWFWRYWVYRIEIRSGNMMYLYKPIMFQRMVIRAKVQIDEAVKEAESVLKCDVSVHSKEWAMPPSYNPFALRKLKLQLAYYQTIDGRSNQIKQEVTIELKRHLSQEILDWLYVMRNITFNTAYVSEYIVPPCLALAVAILIIVRCL